MQNIICKYSIQFLDVLDKESNKSVLRAHCNTSLPSIIRTHKNMMKVLGQKIHIHWCNHCKERELPQTPLFITHSH
jgi:fructose/tagatose bisphosphate aldolase